MNERIMKALDHMKELTARIDEINKKIKKEKVTYEVVSYRNVLSWAIGCCEFVLGHPSLKRPLKYRVHADPREDGEGIDRERTHVVGFIDWLELGINL